MANGVLFIGWTGFKTGMDDELAKLSEDTQGYYERLVGEGKIESYDNIWLRPHGGDLNGFTLLSGDRHKLAEVLMSEEFSDFQARWLRVIDGLGIIQGLTGEEGMQMIMERNARLFG